VTSTPAVRYSVGSLVQIRGRDWIVVTSEDPEILRLRPISGREEEAIGIHRGLEETEIKPAAFAGPDATRPGDYVVGKLLRNAGRLSLRSGAGPFRSLGRISVRPRPYQFVPLIMALRLDPVRMLIADDVGVGKTIEAALIVRELLDRGEARQLCVLCPPHLCEQWQRELESKFHIQAVIIRTSTIAQLERRVPRKDLTVYRYYPYQIVSIDFAKSEHRRTLFLQDCPDLVIVDEVHAAAQPRSPSSREQQQRHELLRELAKNEQRHLLLLTATPHSGVEESFRSLLGLLRHDFLRFDLKTLSEQQRRSLARHLVQRRRGDVSKWLGEETRFPKRIPPFEETYKLTAEYGALFRDVLEFTKETVQLPGLKENRRRVRYWSALALLRCLMSSPAAAVKAFDVRTDDSVVSSEQAESEQASDELRQRETLDTTSEGGALDSIPKPAIDLGSADLTQNDRSKLREYRKRAQAILDAGRDPKIEKAAQIIGDTLKDGYHPVVFCRFVATAAYVAQELERRLKPRFPDMHAVAVTGETGDDEVREQAVATLAESEKRILVATDCLSEGVNLQEDFDAVLHYDLPWNPNRLEQREGRVDRFGQKRAEVRTVVLFSPDNPIDCIVLEVLVRKVREIYSALGIRVSFASDTESVAQALVDSILQSRTRDIEQLGFEFAQTEKAKEFVLGLELDAKREEESRTRFAQRAIQPDEVAREIEATDSVLGDPQAVKRFVLDAAQRFGIPVTARAKYWLLDPTKLPEELKLKLGWQKPVKIVFDSPPPQEVDNAVVLGRNHAFVAYLSDLVLGRALGPQDSQESYRCGAAYTNAVKIRTVILLLRVRYLLGRRNQPDQFAEEIVTVAFRGESGKLVWLPPNDKDTLRLLEEAEAVGNITDQEKQQRITSALQEVNANRAELQRIADARATELEAAHDRLKQQIGGAKVKATAHAPDILGIYVFLPGGKAS
jgi:superfamily II DNA or RNA helicase